MGGTSMKDVRGAGFAGSSPPFRGRAAVDVDVGPERSSPRYHETCFALESKTRERERERWVLLKITAKRHREDDAGWARRRGKCLSLL